jgi:hypothetical protein
MPMFHIPAGWASPAPPAGMLRATARQVPRLTIEAVTDREQQRRQALNAALQRVAAAEVRAATLRGLRLGHERRQAAQDRMAADQMRELLQAARRVDEERQRRHDKAVELLRRHLSAKQLADYRDHGYFEVMSSEGRPWRIACLGQSGNVILLNPDGSSRATYCAHPFGGLPDPAAWLSQARTLIADEARFLRVAICHGGYPLPHPDGHRPPGWGFMDMVGRVAGYATAGYAEP